MGIGWLDLELRHLETFRVLADELSFRATAARLGFAQSAISQHIATLELRVGARLFERGPGVPAVELTSAGKTLLAHTDAILSRVAIAERDFGQREDTRARPIRLGVFQSVSANLVAPALVDATATEPALRVQLVDTGRPIELLAAGELDLALSESQPADPAVSHVELLSDPYVLLAPSSHADLAEPVPLTELIQLPLLTYDSSCHLTDVERELARRGVHLRTILRSDDALTLQQLVASGFGFALLPSLAPVLRDPQVRTYAVAEVRPRLIYLAWNSERDPTQLMRTLIESLVQVASRHTQATWTRPQVDDGCPHPRLPRTNAADTAA
jgi:DNA-binding transcriptional LysR family regulator